MEWVYMLVSKTSALGHVSSNLTTGIAYSSVDRARGFYPRPCVGSNPTMRTTLVVPLVIHHASMEAIPRYRAVARGAGNLFSRSWPVPERPSVQGSGVA